jgi:1-aminocyclopropane-1-carboxylate deaminase/D-cysteine desulfhydrase-like pyridoxal-dependent ACC family enzyme
MEEGLLIDRLNSQFAGDDVSVHLLRCDLYDLEVPGNKFWKMKYNLEEMHKLGQDQLVTFGGAFSNHIAATAAAGKKFGFKTTGIIRGEQHAGVNHTLSRASALGMDLKFIDRETYRQWKQGKVDLKEYLGFRDFYLLPEGGSNVLAVDGCSEILPMNSARFNVIACPVGTGSTLAGIIVSSDSNQRIMGFSSLKNGQYLKDEIQDLLKKYDEKHGSHHAKKKNWQLIHDHHFGGFAKVTNELIDFFTTFRKEQGVELDLIYTAKMMFGLKQMIRQDNFQKNEKILAIHTGGQQGNVSLLPNRIEGIIF